MKRIAIMSVLGLLLLVAAFSGFYLLGAGPDRQLMHCESPELAWLKKEFNLSDAEYSRILKLHGDYRSHCEEMCRRIDAKNAELKQLLAQSSTVTPEIEAKLKEAAMIRAECQKAMLQHFIEVSRTMPPEQGKRYLFWIEEQTILTNPGMHAHE